MCSDWANCAPPKITHTQSITATAVLYLLFFSDDFTPANPTSTNMTTNLTRFVPLSQFVLYRSPPFSNLCPSQTTKAAISDSYRQNDFRFIHTERFQKRKLTHTSRRCDWFAHQERWKMRCEAQNRRCDWWKLRGENRNLLLSLMNRRWEWEKVFDWWRLYIIIKKG